MAIHQKDLPDLKFMNTDMERDALLDADAFFSHSALIGALFRIAREV
jgi:hypothetical protein